MAQRPKRPMSGYMLWMNAVGRPSLRDMHPEFKMTQVSRKCGELWRNMTDDEKSVWQTKAAVAMVKYKAQVENWKLVSGCVKITKRKSHMRHGHDKGESGKSRKAR